jgi:hypothetical protein
MCMFCRSLFVLLSFSFGHCIVCSSHYGFWRFGRVSSSCSISGTRRVNLVTNPVISREWGKDREMITTRVTYPWSFVQSVPITTNVLSLNHGEVYSIQHYAKKFVSELRQVGGFLRVLVIISRSFPHSRLITGFVTRLTRRVPLMEQELLTLPKHLSSLRILMGFV